MEESVTLLEKINHCFACEEIDIRTYSPLTLAFVGDCIFDLVIRTVLSERANQAAHELHQAKSRIVKAPTQAKLVESLYDSLTEEEQAVYKRGRNAKSATSAKNASVTDYRKATGLEALFGYLFLTGQEERVLTLTREGLEKLQIEI